MDHKSAYILGVDLGTSSTKSLIYYLDGSTGKQFQIENETLHPQPGYSEQDPDALFSTVLKVIKDAVELSGQPLAVSFSFAMHSVMAVDQKGHPLSNLLIWSDNRSTEEAATLRKEDKNLEFYSHTGVPIHPMSPLLKIKWWSVHNRDLVSHAHKFISLQEYIFFKLFGDYLAGHSIASTSGFFDHTKLDWFEPALDFAGIREKQLSEIVPSTHICSGLQSDYARQTGLEAQTPFIIGAADGCLANLGTGVVKEGNLALTIGTSGAVRLFGKQPIGLNSINRGSIFNYLLTAGEFISGGATNNGGILLDWARNNLFHANGQIPEYKDILEMAFSGTTAGSDGLIFLPYLYGERAPMWDAGTNGAFIGIRGKHQKKHFARAIIEGLSFALYHNTEIMKMGSDKDINRIFVSGGFTRSKEWIQLIADIFGKEVVVYTGGDASSIGACILAEKALGYITHWEERQKEDNEIDSFQPHPENTNIYRRNFSVYKQLYPSLKEVMHTISAWDKPVH